MPNFTMRQMLEAGVHFGHQTRYWNPKMAPYIFGARGKIHIINLEQTMPQLRDALNFISKLAAKRGNIMFVGTKRAASKTVMAEAARCGAPFVANRWLGGMLTNYRTVRQSIKRLRDLERMHEDGSLNKLTKKEGLSRSREMEKLEKNLGGIKDMKGLPDALFILDVGYESIAIQEAKKLGIPVIGVVDTNHDPDHVDYMIPGNDDAIRAIKFYASLAADAILEGRASAPQAGKDADEFVELDADGNPVEKKERKTAKAKPAAKKAAPKKAAAKKTVEKADDKPAADAKADDKPAAEAKTEDKPAAEAKSEDKPAKDAKADDTSDNSDKAEKAESTDKAEAKKAAPKKAAAKKTVAKKDEPAKDAKSDAEDDKAADSKD